MARFSTVSKAVGWAARKVAWPTVEQVTACDDIYQVLIWNRFLPLVDTPAQVAVIAAVRARLTELMRHCDAEMGG